MLGFVIGTICLAGLIKVGMCGRHGGCGHHGHGRWHGHGHGCGGGRGHSHGHWHGRYGRGYSEHEGGEGGARGGRGFGERAMLRWVFERLDTTHGQEKVILEAIEEVRGPWSKVYDAAGSTFGDFAQAVRGASFDHGKVAETWVAQDKALEALRVATTSALARIHEALDERQRKILADLIERRGGGRPDFF